MGFSVYTDADNTTLDGVVFGTRDEAERACLSVSQMYSPDVRFEVFETSVPVTATFEEWNLEDSEQTEVIELHCKPVTEIKVYWDVQDMVNEGWAYTVYGEECVLASGSVDLDDDASIDDVIDEALFEIGIEGLKHDDFGKIRDGGGYASWVVSE